MQETSKYLMPDKRLVNIDDPSNMNKQAQWLLSPLLVQTYANVDLDVSTPKFDADMLKESKALRGGRRQARDNEYGNQSDFIGICHEINTLQK